MSDRFDPSLLKELSSIVTRRTGLRFPPERYADLERGIRAATRELGFDRADACADWLVSSTATNEQVRALAAHLTIGETYFFRDKAAFELLEQHILPDLIAARLGLDRSLRIWSAGCCTGEEAYSIAISLSRLLPNPTGWQIQILGTDINEQSLRVAREATYGDWSFRDVPHAAIDRWFVPVESGRRRVMPEVVRHVTLAPLNLIEDPYPSLDSGAGAFDLIFCRNVLIYMDGEQSEKIVGNFSRCLEDGGWLIAGAADGSLISHEEMIPAEAAGVTAFRKKTASAVRAPVRVIGASISTLRVLGGAALPGGVFGSKTEFGHRAEARRHDSSTSRRAELPPGSDSVAGFRCDSSIKAMQRASRSIPPAEDMAQAVASAETAYRERRYADVIGELLPLCRVGPASPTAAAILARAYANQGKPSDALVWCERAIEVEKLDARLYYLKASILQEQGEIREAAAMLRSVIFLASDFVMAHVAAGHLARQLGRPEESERHLQTARRLLDCYDPEQTVAEAEGMDARQLARLIAAEPMIGAGT